MRNIEIRRINPMEQEKALQLVRDVFMKFEAPGYSKEGVSHFQAFINDQNEIKKLDIYGAFLCSNIIGVLAMRKAGTHISLFFVKEQYHRQGVGRKLFEYMLKRTSVKRVTVHAAPYAVKVYKKLGFVTLGVEMEEDGIRYTPMMYEKKV